ncbi:PBSX family phage terminase large subunit [Methylobacter sp. Wu1]|uniref:PBSX family phage terminase large subunit n=1 Tax=Methylobacter sp. Wu1 TaxID=3119359 RepID=UPI002F922943
MKLHTGAERGSGKSRFFGGMLIDDHLRNPGMRSVCIREVQKSLKESAKRLLEDCLQEYGLGELQGFKVLNDVIKTPGDGIIIFQGMQDHTADSIKSLEGFDRAWVEEAQTLSATSLRMLRPTIRKPGSEIWFSFNPRRKTDPVDMFLRGEEPPTGAVVVRANWSDNPWFPAELENERLDDLRMNPDQYDHVWEGDYVTVSSGAYFAKHLAMARQEHRIGHVAADPLMTYRAFCDIGGTGAKADAFSMWIVQFVGKEIRWLDYYEAIGQPLAEHVAWLNGNGYSKAKIYLPHDGVNHDKVFDVTYESEFRRAGFDVTVIKNQGSGAATQRIEAMRRIFAQCWFNEPKCKGGLDALGWYHEKRDENRGIGLGPDHDWSSHCCDAAGMAAIVAEDIFDEQNRKKPHKNVYGGGGWMG